MDTYDVEILDRADTPEKEQPQIDPLSPSTEDFMTPETSMDPGMDDQDPPAMRGFYPMPTAPQDINLRISESNIIPGRRPCTQGRSQAYLAALEWPEDLAALHSAFTAGLLGANSIARPEAYQIPKLNQDQLPPPPRGWKEMLSHPHHQGFRTIAEKEMCTLIGRGTFTAVEEPPEGAQILPLLWVFQYKFDQDGTLVKYKARLCIHGDLQRSNSQDTYAATLAVRTFRALMALTAAYDLEALQLDAVNAFLNSPIDEEIYCKCPPGYENLGKGLKLV